MIKCKLLSKKIGNCLIPFIYFDGYYPSIIYLKDDKGNKIEKNNISYHDSNILKLLIEKIDINKSGLDS